MAAVGIISLPISGLAGKHSPQSLPGSLPFFSVSLSAEDIFFFMKAKSNNVDRFILSDMTRSRNGADFHSFSILDVGWLKQTNQNNGKKLEGDVFAVYRASV